MTENTPLAIQGVDGEPTTTSLIVAEGTAVEHRAVLQLIRNNLADFEEFGRVAFEMRPFATAGGTQHREVAVLNEPQATLLLTYMRNSDIVREFKRNLVRAFFELRSRPEPKLEGPELLAAAVLESQKVIEQRDARIFQLEQKVTAGAAPHWRGGDHARQGFARCGPAKRRGLLDWRGRSVMTATYFGATVVGVEDYTPTSATVFVTMPEAFGVLRIDDAALADIEVSA
ncbi:Rha family transcriptional regulator [Gordonia desulfuricans]|uniref:Rha family transcriptional regulator n=1 Tax=Gordonia desulfuricans TaxID=89051 RepID=UPI00073F5FBC|nr:Rha family transcriptional regulator [Gordonia desulfuricans]